MGENNLKKRIRNAQCREKIMSAEEAASFIRPGMAIGSSGFTPAGYPKMIPAALAKRAEAGEKLGRDFLSGYAFKPAAQLGKERVSRQGACGSCGSHGH